MIDNICLLAQAPRYYKFFVKANNFSADQLTSFQVAQLKKVLTYSAEKVPYYSKLFHDIGFDPCSFRYLDDIQKIPYLDKETVRKHTSELLSTDCGKLGVVNCYTSGSSGKPLLIAQDRYSRAAKYALVYYYRHNAGYNLHNRAFSLWGVYATTKEHVFGIDRVKNILYYANNKMTEENNCKVGMLLNEFKPVQFEGYARSFFELGLSLKKNNIPVWSPKSIFCYGDCLTDSMREALEEIYHTKVYDFYSQVENAVAIAERVEGKKELVESFCYPELLDGEHGTRELVSTSFYNFAMPFIRYRINDLIELDDDDNLNDHGSFRRVKSIVGRQNDYLLMRDGRCILSIQRAIYGVPGIVASQFIQKSVSDVELRIVPDETYSSDSAIKISKSLNDVCGADLNLTVVVVDALEKSKSGKVPFVIRKFDE